MASYTSVEPFSLRSTSKSSSSTRRNAALWTRPSTNRSISSGMLAKISFNRCSSAEIRSCLDIFCFLGTKSPLSRDSRVVHARAASKKKGPPLGPQPPAPAPKTGGLCRPATARLNRLNKAAQTRIFTMLSRMAFPAQQLQIVWVVCDVPILPIAFVQRLNMVDVSTNLNAPLPQTFFAKSLCSLDYILSHSFPFGRVIYLSKSSHSITWTYFHTIKIAWLISQA